jgi:D-alanine-D-alanine ligase
LIFSGIAVSDSHINRLKVAVLSGGIGSERQVSLLSGQTIHASLQEAGIKTVLSDITPDDTRILDDTTIDVFFLALHGQFGEDGGIQTLLEQRKLAFTGSGAEASRIAFDKVESKIAFASAGITVPKQIIVTPQDTEQTLLKKLAAFSGRIVIKPARQGSSVGVEIIDNNNTAAAKALHCFKTFGDCMIEEFIKGREITVGIVNGSALPIIEIRSKAAFYDYHAKYIADTTEYLFDTITDTAMVKRIQQTALDCFAALNCRHLSRVDLILTDDGIPYVLEINTLPGFTSHSLLPMAARKAGIPTPELCRRMVETAWNDRPAAVTPCARKCCP